MDPSSSPGASLAHSVGNALKLALAGILRAGGPGAAAWQKKLVGALGALGAADVAESAVRHAARQAGKRGRDDRGMMARLGRVSVHGPPCPVLVVCATCDRRMCDYTGDEARKRPKEESTPPPVGDPASQGTSPGVRPPAALTAPPAAPLDLSNWLVAASALAELAAAHRHAELQQLADHLHPAVLVDVVMANLQWLPSRADFDAILAAQQQQQHPFLQPGAASDPRVPVDPRMAEDPRLAADPRLATDPRVAQAASVAPTDPRVAASTADPPAKTDPPKAPRPPPGWCRWGQWTWRRRKRGR